MEFVLKPCKCGNIPILNKRDGYFVYICQKCKLEGEMLWHNESLAGETWNNTIKYIKIK